jgi:hypothetical protein
MNPTDLADLIERFLRGTGSDWEWDDFISVRQRDQQCERIRERCAILPSEFPSPDPRRYCNDEGLAVLKSIADELRNCCRSKSRHDHTS